MDNKTIEVIKEFTPMVWIACGMLATWVWKLFNKNIEDKEKDIDDFKTLLLGKIDGLTESLNKIGKGLGIIDNEVKHLEKSVDKHDIRISKLEDTIK